MKLTTVSIPLKTRHRLGLLASTEPRKVSVSKLAQEAIDEWLDKKEQQQLDRSYEALNKIIGIAKGGDKNLSTKVDEILYGENGAWRGTDPMTPEEVEQERHG